jgi:hypothetical protein
VCELDTHTLSAGPDLLSRSKRPWARQLAAVSAPYNLARAAAPVGASLLVALGGYTTLLWVLAAGTASAAVAGGLAVERAGRNGDAVSRIEPA